MRLPLRVGPCSSLVGSIASKCVIELARKLAELAEKDAAELRQLTAALVYELQSGESDEAAKGNAELQAELVTGRGQRRDPWIRPLC